jgi:hypothetical protein
MPRIRKMPKPIRVFRAIRGSTCLGAALLLAGCLLAGGCGRGDGLKRYRVKGSVTYDGKPVEFGAIFFEPTESIGKLAPTVYLPVRDGRYDAGDEGPVAGKYQVIVGGVDQASKRVDSDGVTHTQQLFQDYKFDVEIPPPGNILDVVVPPSQAIRR